MYRDLFVKCNNLVALVMQNQAEKVIDLLESGNVDTKILNDIGCCSSPLPLYKLSLCNAILLEDDNWSKSLSSHFLQPVHFTKHDESPYFSFI